MEQAHGRSYGVATAPIASVPCRLLRAKRSQQSRSRQPPISPTSATLSTIVCRSSVNVVALYPLWESTPPDRAS
jgi:hypothetical protein